ncbi:partial Putative deoxyribonuclease RhsC, partial [Anaerolineae bacterium]
DGGPAIQADLNWPSRVAVGPDGSLYIADTYNSRIRKVGTDGIITTVAGTGVSGYSGDGGQATQAELYDPYGVAVGPDGNLYIADLVNSRIRRVGTDGIITTVAGTGALGYSGDGGPATQADLHYAYGVDVGPDGSLYINDSSNSRIRKVGTDGIITTVAGTGGYGYSGDGGPAIQANLLYPNGVAVDTDGSLYIGDTGNNRIRKVRTDGIIITVGGAGLKPGLKHPEEVAVGPDGSLYIADSDNYLIRKMKNYLTKSLEDGRSVYTFNDAGRHLSTSDTLTGAVLYQFTYDQDGLLTAVTDGDGNTTTIERDADGNATAIVGPYGQRTILDIDDNGYLRALTNPAGEVYQCSYTADGLMTAFTDPRGNVHTHTYDARGRLVRDENPAGGFTALERTETKDGFEVTKTTAEGRVSTYLTETLSTGERQITNSFCCGNPIKTVIGTDGSTRITYPDGTTDYTLEGPDPRFGMQSPVIANSTVTTPAGLVQTITGARTVTLSDTNDPLSLQNQTDIYTVNGRIFKNTYDATTQTITTISPMGRVVTSTIDDQGRTRKTEIPGLAPTSFDYDARGRLVTITTGTDTSARVTTLSYNNDGYLDIVSDPLSQDARFEYDKAGRMTRQILADVREIDYGYDANGNMLSLTPPRKEPHTFSYTKVDLEESYNPPALGALSTPTLYEYNLDKQLTNITRPDGKTVQFGYNSKGKLELVTLPDNKTIEYTYDDTKGQLTTVTAPGGETLSFTYDGSLPLNTTWAGTVNGSVSQTYNNNFWITSDRVNGDSTITYQYDNDGLLTAAGSLAISRNAQNGMITGTTLGNVNDTWDYNTFGEVVNYRASQSASEIFSTQFVRDSLGRITEKTETMDSVTHVYNYEYDQTDSLIRVKKDGALISEYTYDSNGNRLTHTTGSGAVTGTYDAQDRLVTYGNNTYTYTTNGELLTKTDTSTNETTTYTYDVLGNLRSVSLPDGRQIEYVIDGMNRRIGKKVNGVLIQGFLYQDQLKPIAELDGNNNVVTRFVYATRVNVPEYMIRGDTTYRIVTDRLGSSRLVVNTSTGQIVQRMDYDEFGNVTNDTNPGFQPFGFAGGMYDRDTKLVRFGVRDYDAEVGRWTLKDPILFAGRDVNLYRYVLNDPVNWRDPLGFLKYNTENTSITGKLSGDTLIFAECFEKCAGFELTVTGGSETTGHGVGSKHYTGQACDFSVASNPKLDADTAEKCFKRCAKSTYWGQKETVKPHWHFQITPGKGNATGLKQSDLPKGGFIKRLQVFIRALLSDP